MEVRVCVCVWVCVSSKGVCGGEVVCLYVGVCVCVSVGRVCVARGVGRGRVCKKEQGLPT